jgi:hypothetical protein
MFDSRKSAMNTSIEGTDNRALADRRKRPTRFITRYMLTGGRRQTIRRAADMGHYYYVDEYSSWLFIVFITLIALCLADSFLTLKLLSHNSIVEVNPVMNFYLTFGHETFVLVKMAITAAAVVILCLKRHYSLTKAVLFTIIIMYAFIVIYEIQLLKQLSIEGIRFQYLT